MSYSIMNDETIVLKDPGSEQWKVLNQYRLTEVFRDAYGNHMLNHLPQGVVVQNAVAAIKKFKGVDEVDIAQWKDLLVDLMHSKYTLGFRHWEYFVYGLEDKSIAQRLEFMAQDNRMKYFKVLNTDREDAVKVTNKYHTYQALKPYFKRDICCIQSDEQKNDFLEFCRRHPRFIVKPVGGSLGKGVEIINSEDYKNKEELFSALHEKKGKASEILCEELIVCDDSIRDIHPESVNSVRIYTYLKLNGEPTLVFAWLKAGQGNAVVDNGGSGGMLAAVDIETGVITTDAADENARIFVAHPDTGFVFKGFQIPRWEELKKMMLEIAPVFPGVPLIGWDVALSKDRGWQMIEGNRCAMINLIQVATKQGCRKQLEAAFEWDIRRRQAQKTK